MNAFVPRRSLLAASAATLAVPASASAAASISTDAELEHLATDYVRTRQAMLNVEQHDARHSSVRGFVATLGHLRERAAAIPATGLAGLIAKAKIINASCDGEPDPFADTDVAWSMVRDLLELPA